MAVEQKEHTEHPRSTWRARVLNEAQRLEDDLAALPPDVPDVKAAAVNIARARAAAAPDGGWWTRIRDWRSGGAFETAWSSLHAAGELLTMHRTADELRAAIPDLLAELETILKPSDSRLARYRATLDAIAKSRDLTPDHRAQIRAARRTANTAAYVAQGVVRRWRNLLLAVAVSLFVVVVALAIVDAAVSDFLPLEGPGGGDGTVDAWKIELLGAFGGAVAAVLAINRFSGYTDPHGLPLYQAILRIPMAAATSVLGIVLLQNEVIDALKPQPDDAALAYAVLFGYAQEPLLRMVDRKAGEVLGPSRGKDDPIATTAPGSKPETGEPAPASGEDAAANREAPPGGV